MANTKTVLIAENCPLKCVDNTQEAGLYKTNADSGENDVQMAAILEKYDTFFGKNDTLTARIRNEVPYACLMGLVQQQEQAPETEKLTVHVPETENQPETTLEIRKTGKPGARSIAIVKTENGQKTFFPLTDLKGERAYALESDARKQQKQIEELQQQIAELLKHQKQNEELQHQIAEMQKRLEKMQNGKPLVEKVKGCCKSLLKRIAGR